MDEMEKNGAEEMPRAEHTKEKPAGGQKKKARRAKKPAGEIPGFSADYRDGGKAVQAESAPDPELDDFLPEGESLPDDKLFTKWEEEFAEEPAAPEEPAKPAAKRRGRRRYGVAVGSLVLLFALAGVCFIAGAIGNKIYQAAHDDSKLRVYDTFLNPVVMQDPAPFESPGKADPLVVQNASLWKAILADGGANYTELDDEGRVVVPLGDVSNACHELFGPDAALEPASPQEESFYTYDSEQNNYHVMLISSDSSFMAYTVSSRRDGDATVLRVGYVSPSDEWRNQGAGSTVEKPSPQKYCDYVLKTDPDTKREYVYAVREGKE